MFTIFVSFTAILKNNPARALLKKQIQLRLQEMKVILILFILRGAQNI